MLADANAAGLSRWERVGLFVLLAVCLAFGVLVVKRMAFGARRHGDFGVYARAAWAVRSGGELRAAACDNGWHFPYPATLAVLLAPLAEPPPGEHTGWALPFAVSAAIWYCVNLACLALALQALASALEQTANGASPPSTAGSRRWWYLRVFPFLACLPVVGETAGRGQVGLIWLALLCGFLACLLRGHPLRAGLCLAGAICLKIIPAFLLLVPLWRRDGRCLAGCALGLVLIGLMIPILGLGLEGTLHDYQELYRIVIAPGLGYGHDQRMATDLTNVTCCRSQSPLAVIHCWLYPDRAMRPTQIAAWIRGLHWLLGGSLTLLTLWAAWPLRGELNRRRVRTTRMTETTDAIRLTLFVSLLILNMLLCSPVCHSHYFCLAIPLFAGLLVRDWRRAESRSASAPFLALMVFYAVANAVPMLPGCELLDDGGVAGVATVLLWAIGTLTLWRECRRLPISAVQDRAAGSRRPSPAIARCLPTYARRVAPRPSVPTSAGPRSAE